MDSPPTSHRSDHIQCLITSKLFGYWTGVLYCVKLRFVFGDPVFVTDEPRPDAVTLARLLDRLSDTPVGLLLSMGLSVTSAIEWFVRYCVSRVIELSGVIFRGFSLIGRLCHHVFGIIIGRRSTIASI